jgi:hypothetical protein
MAGHCGVEVTESSTNKHHTLSFFFLNAERGLIPLLTRSPQTGVMTS